MRLYTWLGLGSQSEDELPPNVSASATSTDANACTFCHHTRQYSHRNLLPEMTTDFDDEFGLSSSDELEQAMADLADNSQKHARSDDVTDDPPSKIQKTTSASVALGVATNVLNNRFKLPGFRLKQSLAISRILEGGSSVVVFPTGEIFLCFTHWFIGIYTHDRQLTTAQQEAVNRSATKSLASP